MRIPSPTSTVGALDDREVQDTALAHLAQYLPLDQAGKAYRADDLLRVVLGAAAQRTSIDAYCRQLTTGPSANTVRTAVCTQWTPATLEAALNHALAGEVRQQAWPLPYPVAGDLTLIPSHGHPAQDPHEIRRGPAKHGTTHFHAYATAYLIRGHRRLTVALTWVRGGEPLLAVVPRLWQYVAVLPVTVASLLLDREFFQGPVLAWLAEHELAYIIPVVCRGQQDPPTATRALAARKQSGWARYTLRRGQDQVDLAVTVVCGNRRGRQGQRGRETRLYAVRGVRRSLRWIQGSYRRRFGIESSYRQGHQARLRTSSRQPVLRLFALGLALLLRNVWLGLRWGLGGRRRGRGGRRLPQGFWIFPQFLSWLSTTGFRRFGQVRALAALSPPPPRSGYFADY